MSPDNPDHLTDLEKKLNESEKLSYLGCIATGIAHNINNPTGVIRLRAQRGLRRLQNENLSDEEAKEIFNGILHEADRLHSIIEKFQDFAKGNRGKRENVALNALVERVAAYFEGQFQSHEVQLVLDLTQEQPQAYANPFVVEEVLINLLTNAREEVEQQKSATVWVKTWQNLKNSGVRVEDNGPGVPEAQRKTLFSPFHSTKAHGTGLGLHFAKSALERVGGTIEYQERPGGGACFIVNLPPPQGENHA